jgi:hypothetical protein
LDNYTLGANFTPMGQISPLGAKLKTGLNGGNGIRQDNIKIDSFVTLISQFITIWWGVTVLFND